MKSETLDARATAQSEDTLTPEAQCLWLLPSGPDQVHTAPPLKASSFNTADPSSKRSGPTLRMASPPHKGDFGYRTPLTSRLHGFFISVKEARDAMIRSITVSPRHVAHDVAFGGAQADCCLAERAGFEPARQGIPTYTLSKRALSATQTPLRVYDWRRGRDSNPRTHHWINGFRDRPDRPLRHLSALLDFSTDVESSNRSRCPCTTCDDPFIVETGNY